MSRKRSEWPISTGQSAAMCCIYGELHSPCGSIYKIGIQHTWMTFNCRRQFHCALFSLEHRNHQVNGGTTFLPSCPLWFFVGSPQADLVTK